MASSHPMLFSTASAPPSIRNDTADFKLPRKFGNSAYKMLQQYKNWHSEDVLQHEFAALQGPSPERKFAVGRYSCPFQAGNRMGDFVESFIWAMLTNRTLLWKYYSEEECDSDGTYVNVCANANTESECDKVLRRADFLPSYDVWHQKLGLPPEPTRLRYYTTHAILNGPLRKFQQTFWYEGAIRDNGLADTTEKVFVQFPVTWFDTLYQWEQDGADASIHALLKTSGARIRARQLYYNVPPHYVYGLVLYECFSIRPQFSVLPQFPHGRSSQLTEKAEGNTQCLVPHPIQKGITVILHSRHMRTENSGMNVTHEESSLQIALKDSAHDEFCQVLLLSDRQPTLRKLRNFLDTNFPHCLIGLAPHDKGDSFESEHGPFAGAGFYQDLSFVFNQVRYVPTTKAVFVGTQRSSGRMVASTVMYAMFQQEHYQQGAEHHTVPIFETIDLGGSQDF